MTNTSKKYLPYLIGSGVIVAGSIYFFRHEIAAHFGKIWDPYTEERLNTLHPVIRSRAKRFILEMQSRGILLRITSDGGYRTWSEQTELYNIGRIYPPIGQTVTNAKAGESYHNYGLAFDVVPIVNGKSDWNTPHDRLIGEVGKKYGFEWGGDFSNRYDWGHLEEQKFGSVWDLKSKYLAGSNFDPEGYLVLAA